MADVQLLTFEDIPGEVFNRWDITGHLFSGVGEIDDIGYEAHPAQLSGAR